MLSRLSKNQSDMPKKTKTDVGWQLQSDSSTVEKLFFTLDSSESEFLCSVDKGELSFLILNV